MQPARAKDIREAIDKVAAIRPRRSDPSEPNSGTRLLPRVSNGKTQNNLRALKGVPSGLRIRVGANLKSSWRVWYTLDRRTGVTSVFEIAPREEAYR